MKIYNEIILKWNDDTKSFDTLYEDSFEYDGPMMLAVGPCGSCTCTDNGLGDWVVYYDDCEEYGGFGNTPICDNNGGCECSCVQDECGVCCGDGSTCAGCDGVPNSGLVDDDCGECGGVNYFDEVGLLLDGSCDCNGNVFDCNDICGGLAVEDCAGVCNGSADEDCNQNCCGGTTTVVCLEEDCAGDCGGSAVVDVCGICGGPGEVIECDDGSFVCVESQCLIKKILKDKPYPNFKGQYNFDSNNRNKGIVKNIDNKFVNVDLYTLSEENETNEFILKNNFVWESNTYFKIKKLTIRHTGVGYKMRDTEFKVALIGSYNAGSTYGDMLGYINNIDDDTNLIYKRPRQHNGKRWSPGTIIEDQTIINKYDDVENIKYNDNYKELEYSGTEYVVGGESNHFPTTFCDDPDNPSVDPSDDTIDILVYMKGDAKYDKRRKRIQHFQITRYNSELDCSIPLANRDGNAISIIPTLVNTVVGDGGGNLTAAAYVVSEIEVEIVTPYLDSAEFAQTELQEGIASPHKIKDIDNQYIELFPNIVPFIGWMDPTEISSLTEFQDFRPISYVNISGADDLQSYYEYGKSIGSSAPIKIDLKFKIMKVLVLDDVDGTEYNELFISQYSEKFKFFVLDWNDASNEIEDWDGVIDNYPSDIGDLFNKQRNDNTFIYADCQYSHCNGDEENLSHFYQTPGIKNIKAVVFSYVKNNNTNDENNNSDGDTIQAIRWKFMTIRINIGVDNVYMEDFGDLGGVDYTTIPWPHTAPIISGISEDSKYMNSVDRVLDEGKFLETDLLDSILLEKSKNNDELGNYLGKVDIEQVRYFTTGVFDMNYLLGIDNLITTDGSDFYPYTNSSYWNGETNQFLEETLATSIFIDDNIDSDLKSKCILELNMGDNDGKTVMDSSGNGNKGIIIGDYKVNKPSKDSPMRRDSNMDLPKTKTENGAL